MHQVIRTALLDTILDGDAARLVTIEAPGGSGKSTLLRQLQAALARRGQRAVVADPGSDADAATLARALIGALGGGDAPPAGALAGEDADRLAQAMRAQPAPVHLILDDFHRVKSPATIRLLGRIAELEPPPPVTLVLASRTPAGLPVSRLRVEGRLVELGPGALRFSEAEAEALGAAGGPGRPAGGPLPDPATWRAFARKVDGWAVALQLALLLLRARTLDIADLLGFSGTRSEMAAYLSQRIVAGVAPADRALLCAAAAFETLRPDVLAAALGPAPAARLAGLLETLALPMESGGPPDERRLHGIVAGFLAAQAAAGGVDLAALRRRAAVFLEQRGEWRRAIRYALRSGDLAFAAGVTERGGGWRLIYRGGDGTARQFAELAALPPAHFAACPRTALGLAVSAAKRGELDLAQDLTAAVAAAMPADDDTLPAELRLIGALMDLYGDRPIAPAAVARLEADIADARAADPVRLALTQNLLCFCSLQDARFGAAIRYGRLSVATFRTAGSDFGAAHLPLHIGQAEFLSGQSENARATLLQHAQDCLRQLGPGADLTLMTKALLAEVDLERGQFPDDPAELAEAFRQLGQRDSWFDPLASLVQARMRIALARGEDADAVLLEAENIAGRRRYRRLARLTGLLRADMLLRTGQPEEAARLLAPALPDDDGGGGPDPVNLRGAPVAALQARLALARGDAGGALRRLDALLARPGAAANVRRLTGLVLLRLRILIAAGDTAAAAAALERLALSHRTDLYCLPFAEEGAGLVRFVRAHADALDPGSLVRRRLGPALALAERLVPAAAAGTGAGAIARLTGSEGAVLLRLEQGLSNKAIARDLKVSENTVKYHLTNIYQKLGAGSRTAALTRARQSGLMAALHRRAASP